jgi:hypothetical protein
MSLIYCPECGHEVSAAATACPNCAHPMAPVTVPVVEPVAERRVVAARPVSREGFPPWAFVPIGVGALLLLIFAFVMMRSSDDANTNVNVNMAARRANGAGINSSTTSTVPSTESQSVTVPGSTTTASIPPSSTMPPASMPSSSTTVPGSTGQVTAPPSDKGSVVIKAQVMMPRASSPSAVRSTKFYLLDKDLESILSDARLEPIEGNTLAGSMGLAAVFPDRYGDFQRRAMRALAAHIKYSGTTDSGGNANLANVTPREYYLFGITRVGKGFAMWDSQVSVVNGENILNLSPQAVTEIRDDPSGLSGLQD